MPKVIEKYFFSKPVQSYFNTIKRFLPAEQDTTAAVGLDIGSGDCKFIELNKLKDGFELARWGIEPIRSGDIKGAVEAICTSLDIRPKSLFTSVFGKGTLIRYIDMPRMTLEELKSSFSIEADKYFPFAQDQIYTDCFILDPKEKGKTMSVMAAAAKKELVDRRIKLLSDLGVPVEFIGLNPIVLANMLSVLGYGEHENTAEIKESAVALLDMGESVSSLTILVNKIPWFTRDIFVGGRDITKSISNALGIGFQEAEELKRNPASKKEEVIKACESAIMNMIQELRLSMDYFATEKNREISLLLLTGGTSMLDGVVDTFEKNLEIKVGRWDPLNSLKVADGVSTDGLDRSASKLGVAIGLALYQYD